MLRVEVDGKPVAEVGPGAILGEMALLREGKRMATLRAVTPCRVAVVPKDRIDRQALEEIAMGRMPDPNANPDTTGLTCGRELFDACTIPTIIRASDAVDRQGPVWAVVSPEGGVHLWMTWGVIFGCTGGCRLWVDVADARRR